MLIIRVGVQLAAFLLRVFGECEDMKKFWMLLLVAALAISGCGGKEKASQSKDSALAIDNGGRKLTFAKAPQRLVTLRQHITETALELDLDKHIVGASDIIDPPVAMHLQQRYSKLPIIAEKYPSPEVLLAAEPDLVWVDRKWAFVKNQLGSMQNIEKQGIKIYLSEGGFHDRSMLEHVYEDLHKVGKLFEKEEKAEKVFKQMQTKVQHVTATLGDIKNKVKVLDFDGSRNNLAFIGCRCMADDLITKAGGINIFDDIEKEWATVNWEEVAKRNPDVIIVHEYRGISGASKIEMLKKHPVLQEVTAIKNNRFIIVNLDEIYEGVRNADTIVKLAQGFYPEKFF